MNQTKTIFVLGAGFTKAFFRKAPLQIDNYNITSLQERYGSFEHATKLLNSELSQNEYHKVNIERLMTRLDSGMPYDLTQEGNLVLSSLLSDLKMNLKKRIEESRSDTDNWDEFVKFAQYCLANKIDCITFNYDEFFDEALLEAQKPSGANPFPGSLWNPDWGYGFYCKRVDCAILNASYSSPNHEQMRLLKMHGSLNWWLFRGTSKPYSINSLMHCETWTVSPLEIAYKSSPNQEDLENYLMSEPFIVPPVLDKTNIMKEPILQYIWTQAFNTLKQASKVVFVGYSLPVTDLASTFLFKEGINSDCNIEVVSKEIDERKKERTKSRYHELFPWIQDEQFRFDGALDWTLELRMGHIKP